MNDLTVHETLVKARNLIDREGWVQGPPIAADGFCMFGACGVAAGFYGRRLGDSKRGPEARQALTAAMDVLGGLVPDANAIRFNEVAGRTKDEVLGVFDEAIAATAPEPDLTLETRDPIPA